MSKNPTTRGGRNRCISAQEAARAVLRPDLDSPGAMRVQPTIISPNLSLVSGTYPNFEERSHDRQARNTTTTQHKVRDDSALPPPTFWTFFGQLTLSNVHDANGPTLAGQLLVSPEIFATVTQIMRPNRPVQEVHFGLPQQDKSRTQRRTGPPSPTTLQYFTCEVPTLPTPPSLPYRRYRTHPTDTK